MKLLSCTVIVVQSDIADFNFLLLLYNLYIVFVFFILDFYHYTKPYLNFLQHCLKENKFFYFKFFGISKLNFLNSCLFLTYSTHKISSRFNQPRNVSQSTKQQVYSRDCFCIKHPFIVPNVYLKKRKRERGKKLYENSKKSSTAKYNKG